MTHKEVIAALRSTPSRSKRELFDTAADMIESLTQDKTVVSNADRIRAMSDEEMAELLTVEIKGLAPTVVHLSLMSKIGYISRKFAVEEAKKWLKQPAKE